MRNFLSLIPARGAHVALTLSLAALGACSEPKATPAATVPAATEPAANSSAPASPDQLERAARTAPPAVAESAAQPAPGDGGVAKQLAELFGGYEFVPARQDLLAVAPEPTLIPALWALYNQPGQRLIVRTQALLSLRFFPSPQVQGWFEQILRSPATVDAVRRPLAKAYGFAFGEPAVPLLSELLAHADLHTRDSSARALGAIGSDAARKALQARASIEAEPTVRSTIDAQLARPKPSRGQP